MNKYLTIGLFFLILIVITGCVINNPKEEKTIVGNYRSVSPLTKDVLNCYCRGGYLTTLDNAVIPICFEKEDDEINCKNIQVTGFYKNIKINSEPLNACPSDERNYFHVSSYECK